MPEDPLEAMTLLLVPLPWPMMLILSVALGVLAYVVLENSRHFRDTQLKEGVLGLSGFIAIGAFLVWLAVLTFRSLHGSKLEKEFGPFFICALVGLVYAVCVFGLALFVVTFGCIFRRVLEGAERKEEEERRALAEAERVRQENSRIEFEAKRREAERLASIQSRQKADDQTRRENARLECDSAYAIAAPEISSRFSKSDFLTFISKYMADSFPPEQVEERAEQLKAIIQQHQEKIVPAPKFRSIQELAGWFESQKTEIETVQDARIRATLLVQLKERYSELTAQMLSEFSP